MQIRRTAKQLMSALMVFACVAPASASRGNEEPIELFLESGRIEITVEITPPDAPAQQESRILEATGSIDEELTLMIGDLQATASVMFGSQATGEERVLYLDVQLTAAQAGAGATASVRARTLDPIVFRLLDVVEDEGGVFQDTIVVTPRSGAIESGVPRQFCPGSYEAGFDREVTLGATDQSTVAREILHLVLSHPEEPDVRYHGAWVEVRGTAEDDQGVEVLGYDSDQILDGGFNAEACTSSGLVEGRGAISGNITDLGNGAYEVRLAADASSSQPEGYGGRCSMRASEAGSLTLRLAKPKAYVISSTSVGGAFVSYCGPFGCDEVLVDEVNLDVYCEGGHPVR